MSHKGYVTGSGSAGDGFTNLISHPNGDFIYGLAGSPYTQQGTHHGQIVVFRQTASGALVPVPGARLRDLAAPLSLAFTPDGKYAYLLLGGTSELGNSGSLRVYRVHADGSLKPAASQSSLDHFAYDNPDSVLVNPDGRHLYVSSTQALDEYKIKPDGGLEEVFSLPGPTSDLVCARGDSLLFALRRMPDHEHAPGFSALLMAIHIDKFAHLSQTTYLIRADGSLQEGALPGAEWGELGFASDLHLSEDGKHLYALNPTHHPAVYAYSVNPYNGALALTCTFRLPTDHRPFDNPVAMTVVDAPK